MFPPRSSKLLLPWSLSTYWKDDPLISAKKFIGSLVLLPSMGVGGKFIGFARVGDDEGLALPKILFTWLVV